MDLHIVPGIEAKHAAEAHREDFKIQEEFGCRCMTYWVDEERGCAFCLIDAPNEEAVRNMHDSSHGLVPHEIIQVNSNVVEAFLGRIKHPKIINDHAELKIFNDPAFRIIMVIETKDKRLLQHELGATKTLELLSLFNTLVREQLSKYEGREVELGGDGFVVSFVSVSQAVLCAASIQKVLHIAAELIHLRIGVHAGLPINNSNTLFGDTIKFARHLCLTGKKNQAVMSSVVRELYKDDMQQKIVDHPDRFRIFSPSEEKFLKLLIDNLNDNWQNAQFSISDFCRHMSMSKSQLYRKSTSITGMSPNMLLREFRLLKSLDLLKKEDHNITQTTFETGFSSPSYFSKCFQKRFGISPLTYLKAQA